MKFVSILSLLVLSAIGLAESRRRRRRRDEPAEGTVGGKCQNVEGQIDIECQGELHCCDEGEKDNVGVCRVEECPEIEITFGDAAQDQQQQEQQAGQRRRYRRRY